MPQAGKLPGAFFVSEETPDISVAVRGGRH